MLDPLHITSVLVADLIADEATVNAPVCFVEKLLALRQR